MFAADLPRVGPSGSASGAECEGTSSIADHGYVMESGRVVFSGKAADLLSHPDVREFYLGAQGKPRKRVIVT